MPKYAGADWLQKQINYRKKPYVLSPLAREVADIVGQLYYGLYHWETAVESKAWLGDKEISLCVPMGFASESLLTLLVLMAHKRKISISIRPATPHYLRLAFRKKDEHESIEQAIARFENIVNFDS